MILFAPVKFLVKNFPIFAPSQLPKLESRPHN